MYNKAANVTVIGFVGESKGSVRRPEGGRGAMDGAERTEPRPGSLRQDDAAPPNGGAVNRTYRQTTRRVVCRRLEGDSPPWLI
jgi:hypothetical protein